MKHKKHIYKMQDRKQDAHKGDFGKVLVLAGSPGMTGAAYLASQGALKAGSGLVTCGIPASLAPVMEMKLTEVMKMALAETRDGYLSRKAAHRILEFAQGCDSVAIGPGLGVKRDTAIVLGEVLKKVKCPVIADADALNILAKDMSPLKKRKYPTILTPHPGEMARLMKKDTASIQEDRLKAAKTLAKNTGSVVCLKGHRTVVASPSGEIYLNQTGNSGMATGGTGDVLTGIAASFAGQGVNIYSAAVSAVYIHGLSGDIALRQKGPYSLTATDVIDALPQAFKKAGLY